MRRLRTVAAIGASLALLLAACGDDDDDGGGDTTPAGTEAPSGTGGESSGDSSANTQSPPTEVGEGEGELNLIAWAGYAEDGSTDPAVDWVTPFEEETGCQTNVKIGNTSDEMFQLMQTGEYDGVSASGDASVRLIDAGLVAPVNVDLISSYPDLSSFLKDQNYNTSGGLNYGVPHGWGANLLMYNTEVVSPAPDSWGVVFDPASPYSGNVTAYDAPIYIADAALYLKATQPDLGIEDPYSLTQDQFDAAVDLLKDQRGIIGEYWSNYAVSQQAFEQGTSVLGTTWQVIANLAAGNGAPVATVLPKEGSTGWSDTWMVASDAKHPSCMYQWMDYITTPEVQAQVAYWFGEAPANPAACELITDDPTHCDVYKATDESFYDGISFWATPRKECLDGSGSECVPFADWIKAWTEIKG